MRMWKTLLALAAMLLSTAVMPGVTKAADYAPKPGGLAPGGGEGHAGIPMKVVEVARPMTGVALGMQFGMTQARADEFAQAYLAERQRAQERVRAAGPEADALRKARLENREYLQKLLLKYFDKDDAQRAYRVLASGLERDIIVLLQGDLEKAKLQQAGPLLVKYHIDVDEMQARARREGLKWTQVEPQIKEIRQATVQDLAPIIGQAAANSWEGTAREYRGVSFDEPPRDVKGVPPHHQMGQPEKNE